MSKVMFYRIVVGVMSLNLLGATVVGMQARRTAKMAIDTLTDETRTMKRLTDQLAADAKAMGNASHEIARLQNEVNGLSATNEACYSAVDMVRRQHAQQKDR